MTKAPIIYIPHGGGPMPLLEDESHASLIAFLRQVPDRLPKPDAIILISGHWEESIPTLSSSKHPEMLFDYYGFPPEAYKIDYPAPGAPDLAKKVQSLIGNAALNENRGYDHGAFVPLKLMYPQADIPCIQLSLIKGLNAAQHIELGASLSELREDNIMIIGSGMSFHNLQAIFAGENKQMREASDTFNQWLINSCTSPDLSLSEKTHNLQNWTQAPYARFCHPREEHLLPLHVCFGAARSSGDKNNNAEVIFNEVLMGHKVTGLLWH